MQKMSTQKKRPSEESQNPVTKKAKRTIDYSRKPFPSKKECLPHCKGNRLLFSENIKAGSGMMRFYALTWAEAWRKIMPGIRNLNNAQHFYERRHVFNDPAGGGPPPPCVLYFDIDDSVDSKDEHDDKTYLCGFRQALKDILQVTEPLRVQASCGMKNGRYKVSYHILVPGVHFESIRHLDFFLKQKCRIEEFKDDKGKNKTKYFLGNYEIDKAVYHEGFWRMPYNSKKGSQRVLIPRDLAQESKMTLKEFKELSIHFVPPKSRKIDVNMPQCNITQRVANRRYTPQNSKRAPPDTCILLDKARRLGNIRGEFEAKGSTRNGNGIIVVAEKLMRCWNREHTSDKTLHLYDSGINCMQCGFKKYSEEHNQTDVHLLIAKDFETTTRKKIEAHWLKVDPNATVEPFTETNHRLTYRVNTNKGAVHSFYFMSSGRLVFAAKNNQCGFAPKSELVAPKYPEWDVNDFGTVQVTPVGKEKTSVKFDGDTIRCYGTFLPNFQLGDRTHWDAETNILWLAPGTYVVIASMGRGKSFTMTQAIRKGVEAGALGLYPTYRRSLANGLTAELRRNGVKNVVHYRDDQAKIPQAGGVYTCQLESIPNKVRQAKPTVIVSDEVQGLTAQFASTKTMRGGESYDAWRVLKNKYRRSRHNIFMDADFDDWSPRSKHFVKHMCGNYTRIVHAGKPKQRTFIDCKDEGSLRQHLVRALLGGLKVILVSNTASFLERTWPFLPKDCKARAFYGDKRLEPHMDINEIAADLDLLAISAGSIGSGVSIEIKHMQNFLESARGFDVCFAYGMAHDMAAPARDWYQALSRVREVLRGLFFFHIKDAKFSEMNPKGLRQQRHKLFDDRRQAAVRAANAMAHKADIQSKLLAHAGQVLEDRPLEAANAGITEDTDQQTMLELFVARGLIPSPEFVANLCRVEREREQSTWHFRELFIERALNDGHTFFTLSDTKDESDYSAKGGRRNHMKEIVEAPSEPVQANADWNASEAVKIKSYACHFFPKINKELITWPPANSAAHVDTPSAICSSIVHDLIEDVANYIVTSKFFMRLVGGNAIPNVDDIVRFKSLRKRFQSLQQLVEWHTFDLSNRRLHGSTSSSSTESHIRFLKALRDVWKITPDTPYCFEPSEDDAKQRIAVAEQLVPGLKKSGHGSDFQKIAQGLMKHFENIGVMTGLVKTRCRPPGKKNKEQRWAVDDSVLLEYADLMDIELKEEDLARRTHRWDFLRNTY